MKQATSRFVQENGEAARYGYTFWIQDDADYVPADTFMSRGHNLNHSVVIPSMDLVIVRQGNESQPGREGAQFFRTVVENIVAAIPEDN